MDDERYRCEDCHLFVKVDDVVFKGEKKIPCCPVCGAEIPKACPNDHCHCSHAVSEGFAVCKLCGKFMCPTCYSHDVLVLSRVTGYYQDVGGFNEAKVQELKDRHHTENSELVGLIT